MIVKTVGLVLRYVPVTNTSRVVSWLTPDRGRITTLIRGSQRPKSFFLGQYDLFYTCELVYYERRLEGLHVARECAALSARESFRRDWKACAAASYLAGLALRTTLRDTPQEDLYNLYSNGFDAFAADGADSASLAWFELRLLSAVGLAPRLQHCVDCDAPLTDSLRSAGFDPAAGGLLCGRCRRHRTGGTRPLAPAVLATLRSWQRAPSPRIARRTRIGPTRMAELEHLLGLFLSYHLELDPAPRDTAYDILHRHLPRRDPTRRR